MNAASDQGRERVFAAVRKALSNDATGEDRIAAIKQRIERHAANLVPQQARQVDDERLMLFIEHLQGQGADVRRTDDADAIPGLVADYLRENNLPATVKTGTDPTLDRLPWERASSLQRHVGPVIGDDQVAMSRALTAAAETGTLFLVSGSDNPTTHNFLPETHIILVAANDIAGSYEDAWNRLRAEYGARTLPRTVNLISGPSRTADIEQTIIMGAHGPRRLLVVVVE